jgi:hypothetical protein
MALYSPISQPNTSGANMPIRKLIDDRMNHLTGQIVAMTAEKNLLSKQMEAFNFTTFAYGDPVSGNGIAPVATIIPPSSEVFIAKTQPFKTKMAVSGAAEFKAETKAKRKPRVESGPRRTGLKAEVLQHIMSNYQGDQYGSGHLDNGRTSISDIAKALAAKSQSVRVAIESLLKADKITQRANGGYEPKRSGDDTPLDTEGYRQGEGVELAS